MVETDMCYSGGDLNLQGAGNVWNPDFNNPNDVEIMKQCSKNILYVVANSNAVRGEFKVHLPRWQVGLYIGTGVVAAGLATWGFFVFFKMFRRKKEVNAA